MKTYLSVLIALLVCTCPARGGEDRPNTVVRKLYKEVVARKPLGIPRGADRAAIWPFLSKRLTQTLDTAQACEADYFRKHPDKTSKPQFGWLESGIFSGENEEAMPAEAVVERTDPGRDGSFRVNVRLAYTDGLQMHGRPSGANAFHWDVVAVVISEDRRFVVDDVLLFKDGTKQIQTRLSSLFIGCNGPHWSGESSRDR